MNEKQSVQQESRQAARDQTAPGGALQRQEPSERKPSKIELQEWRGSGVCGDRHTD